MIFILCSIKGKDMDTIVNQWFMGKLVQRLRCLKCNETKELEEEFYDLILDIPTTNLPRDDIEVNKLITNYLNPVHLEGKLNCTYCSTNANFEKTTCITKYPEYLVLNLARFGRNEWNMIRKKATSIFYKPVIDVPLSQSSPQSGTRTYALIGVIEHNGLTLNSGHYYCYARDPIHKNREKWNEVPKLEDDYFEDKWFKFDDERINETRFNSFAEHLVRNAWSDKTAQVLVYHRLPVNVEEQHQVYTIDLSILNDLIHNKNLGPLYSPTILFRVCRRLI